MLGGVAVWRASGRRLESASRRRARGRRVCLWRKGEWDLKCEVVLSVKRCGFRCGFCTVYLPL